MTENDSTYSVKPYLPKKDTKNALATTVLSVILFALLFYFFIVQDILLIAIVIAVLFVHEMGHYMMMKKYKYEDMSMVFIPFLGAMVKGKKTDGYSQNERAHVILAGPIPGIVFGLLLFGFGIYFNSIYLSYSGVLFALINVLNLIPLDPLDGGQLLYLLFFDKKDSLRLYFLLFSSLLIIAIGFYFQSYIVVIFGFLLGVRVRAFQKIHKIHQELRENDVNYITTYDDLSDRDFVQIRDVILNNSTLARKMSDADMMDSPEFREVMASEVNSVLEVPVKMDMSHGKKLLYLFIWLGSMTLVFFVFYVYFPKLIELVDSLNFDQNE